eukprot:g9137.t1
MLPLLDKPLIQYAIDEAREAGIEEFIFVTGRHKEAIEGYFDCAFELETWLERRHEKDKLERLRGKTLRPGKAAFLRQQNPLGLGHAVWCARAFIGHEPFAVILPDDVIIGKTGCLKELLTAYNRHGGHWVAAMDVPKEQVSRYGIVTAHSDTDQILRIDHVVEKPPQEKAPSQTAVIGRYILDPSIFDLLDPQNRPPEKHKEVQLTDALNTLAQYQPLYGYYFSGRRFDCGTLEGMLEATIFEALRRPDLSAHMKQLISQYATSS